MAKNSLKLRAEEKVLTQVGWFVSADFHPLLEPASVSGGGKGAEKIRRTNFPTTVSAGS
ncbi:hypothetical protein KQX54_007233, partial [Cotesia glomerata]